MYEKLIDFYNFALIIVLMLNHIDKVGMNICLRYI